MARVIAMLWLVAAGSAHAAYMRGTLTFDDGRTATLALRRFSWVGSWNEGHRAASVRCRGDACFGSTAFLGLYYDPNSRFHYYWTTDFGDDGGAVPGC